MGGVEYQVTKVDPTDPQTKGAVHQVYKVSEEVAATLGGKVYRARIINDPTEPTVAGKVYQIVLIGDPDDPSVKGKVYNAILTGGSEAVVVGPAVSPLALDDAVADTMEYVKAFGGTELRSLPQGYQQLVSLTTDDASYFDADYIINSFDVDVTTDAAMTLLASGPNMLWGFMGSSSNLPRWGVGSYQNRWLTGANATQSVGEPDTNRHITTGVLFYNENDTPCYNFVLDGVESTAQGISNSETITENTLSTFVGARNNRGTAGHFNPSTFYSFKIKKAGELVVNMVPAKRLSDNVVGFYDTVRDRFFTNAGTGTITAGEAAVTTPTPDAPMNIVSNNGVLKFSSNEFDPSDVELGYYRNSSSGAKTESPYNFLTAMMPVKPNTSYVMFGRRKTDNSLSAYNRIYWFDSNQDFISTSSYTVNTVTIVTSPANAAYAQGGINESGGTSIPTTQEIVDSYNWVFQQGSAEVPYAPYVEGGLYVDGTVETIKDSLNNTATAEMLLKVGDYQDVQSILDGVVTRNVGVLVLDGTESWQLATATDLVQFYTSRTQGVIANNLSLTSTIAPYGCTATNRTEYDFGCYSGNSGNLCFQMKGSATLTTVSAWTQYLAAQYAAGTPVIVVYPLADSTTETVTGQTLQVQDGDNTLEITQASLSGLELEAKYEKEVD